MDPNTRETRSRQVSFASDHVQSQTDCLPTNLNCTNQRKGPINEEDLAEDFHNCGLKVCSLTAGHQDVFVKSVRSVPDNSGGTKDLI